MSAQFPHALDISYTPLRGNRRIFYGCVVAAVLVVVTTTLVSLYYLREQAERSMVTSSRSQARSLEQMFASHLDALDVTLLVAADEISRQLAAGRVDQHAINRYLENLTARLPYVDLVRATNEKGDVIYGPGTLSPPSNVSDRDYFVRLRDDRRADMLISEPLFGRIDKIWVWPIARRITRADGSFGGVIFARIKIADIEKMLTEIKLDSKGIIALRDRNFALIARYEADGRNSVATGDKKLSDPFVKAFAKNPDEGTYDTLAADSIDGVSRTYSYRRNPKYGFIISDGLDRKDALAQWRKQSIISAALMAGFILLALMVIWIDRKAWLRQTAEDKEREIDAQRLEQLLFKSRQVEAELNRANTLLQDSISSLAEGFTIFDENDRLVLCNEAYLNIYNTSREFIVPGATFEEIVRKGAERGQYREAVGRIDEWVRERVQKHQAANGGQFEQVLDDGRCLLIIEYRTPGGFIVGNRIDITARKLAEAQTRLAASVFDNAAEGITITDSNNNIISVNPAFTAITGYAAAEVIGKNPRLLASGEQDPALYKAMWAEIGATGRWKGEIWNRRKNGETYCGFLSIGVVRNERGETSHYCGTFVDITARKIAEARLAQLNAELETRVAARTAEMEEANKRLEAFSYTVAHDLRAPLRAISGFSALALQNSEGKLDPVTLGHLRRVVAGSERMGLLIDDLLNLARVSRQVLTMGDVNLSKLSAAIVANLTEAHKERAVRVTIQPDMKAQGDSALLRVVLDNLIGNAWKFTAKTGAAHIEIGCTQQDGGTVYCVRDNGTGFDMEYAHKLFAPFQRLHTYNEFEGTGIGLATVKTIIQRHGGRVWIESAVDRGTAVFFTLGDRPDQAG